MRIFLVYLRNFINFACNLDYKADFASVGLEISGYLIVPYLTFNRASGVPTCVVRLRAVCRIFLVQQAF